MTNDYTLLDTFSSVPFTLPPLPTGEYIVTDAFNTTHKFHFRRMPRARRYTGRFGLFFYDPDSHWTLVGVVGADNSFEFPVEQPNDLKPRLELFLRGCRELVLPRCAWCGRKLDGEDVIHSKSVCSRNLPKS
jgi:hypothetical protein